MLTRLSWMLSRRKTGLSRWLMQHAAMYLDNYNDFTYDFEHNGENTLLTRLSGAGIRTVFDVGANVGGWSQAALRALPGAHVHAFELSDSTRATLRQNLQHMPVTVSTCALGAVGGEIEYKDYGTLSTVNSMVATSFHDSKKTYELRKAKILRGDDYLLQNGIDKVDLLKIDVEGAEMLVLQGFSEALRSSRIRVIQFEYGFANADAGPGNLMKDFYALLEGAGYTVGRLWSAGVRFSDFDYRCNNFDSGPNYVAVLRTERQLVDQLRSAC